MIIQIDEKTRIRGTKTCWQLEKKQKRRGVDEWRSFKYFSKFASAFAAACEREIRTHPAKTLAEAIKAADAIAARYGQLLDCALDEISKRSEPTLRAVS